MFMRDRSTGQHLSRRPSLGVAAVALLPVPSRTAGKQAPPEASALVQRFYELRDAYQDTGAYDLLGKQW